MNLLIDGGTTLMSIRANTVKAAVVKAYAMSINTLM